MCPERSANHLGRATADLCAAMTWRGARSAGITRCLTPGPQQANVARFRHGLGPFEVKMSKRQRQDLIDRRLAEVPLFEGLSKKELRLISQLATYVEEPAGAVLTEEGMSGREFFVVLDGWIEVYHDGRIIADYGPGYVFGEIALIDDRPRTATVVAKTPVTLDVIAQREFWAMLDQVPKLSKKLLKVVARRLADLERRDTTSSS